MAVVNSETDFLGKSSAFLESISSYTVRQNNFTNLSSAIDSVKRGENWGVLHIGPEFTLSLINSSQHPTELLPQRETANNQSVRRHLDAFTRGRIIEKLEEGRSVTSVAAEFGIAHSIVSRLWRQFQTTGTAIWGFSSGRPRGTTPADDQRLHGGGLFARRPVRCVPLTHAHRRRRSLWCREHRNWRDNEWGQVLFTDESRFSLSSDSHRILIWRERGSRNHPSNIIERDRYGGRGVLV
ncbi:transposable element Tcb2 transposase [Trichonephila clavipes]|nr:transposable element Tcb2 transposase [Trichonephila clavipes]